MNDKPNDADDLLARLQELLERQEGFFREIDALREEINRLKGTASGKTTEESGEKAERTVSDQDVGVKGKEAAIDRRDPSQLMPKPKAPKQPASAINTLLPRKSNLEKFIGENLINKIGIVITVFGVAIGAKYAIDHELISPLTRIILGYLVGIALLGFAIRLKKNYKIFSSVLLSGSMAILYFITFAAYSFYGLLPQVLTFAIMVLFTVFTVLAALHYNRQVIAHIGLVGAYAIPFLLSDDPENVVMLFTYMAIINAGILVIAFHKYWKPLYYLAFGLTWLIYISWYLTGYHSQEHLTIALVFVSIFFVLFYLTFLAYKLLRKEKFDLADTIMLLANSFIFFGLGYHMLDNHEAVEKLLGLFTLCNAIVHFIVSMIIYRGKLANRNLLYLVSGLVLVFITIAIPVQLDGNWVTLLWVGEAALLFWIGRTRDNPVYEKLSYPLMVLAFISIAHDWSTAYLDYTPTDPETRITPLFNINFLSSLLFISAFGFINALQRNKKYAPAAFSNKGISDLVTLAVPAILLISVYYAFRMEIANYWNQLFLDSKIRADAATQDNTLYHRNMDLVMFKAVWIINYSLVFVSVLAFVNVRTLRNQSLGLINLALIVLAIVVFLTQGLYALSELREGYLKQDMAQYFMRGCFNLAIRYISMAVVAFTLFACHRYLRQDFMKRDFKLLFDFLLHISVLWIASSELIHWMDIAGSAQSYKVGLSILWGVYSLFLIALGIWKKKKHLRVGAIALFGVTLIKLFFYDISVLDTIAKTIVFVSLGVLLLISSFLYSKYKHIISDEPQD